MFKEGISFVKVMIIQDTPKFVQNLSYLAKSFWLKNMKWYREMTSAAAHFDSSSLGTTIDLDMRKTGKLSFNKGMHFQ